MQTKRDTLLAVLSWAQYLPPQQWRSHGILSVCSTLGTQEAAITSTAKWREKMFSSRSTNISAANSAPCMKMTASLTSLSAAGMAVTGESALACLLALAFFFYFIWMLQSCQCPSDLCDLCLEVTRVLGYQNQDWGILVPTADNVTIKGRIKTDQEDGNLEQERICTVQLIHLQEGKKKLSGMDNWDCGAFVAGLLVGSCAKNGLRNPASGNRPRFWISAV